MGESKRITIEKLPQEITLARRFGESRDFLIRRCQDTDLFDVLRLQLRVSEAIDDAEIYSLVDEEDILESLKLDDCFGVYWQGQLAAFTMMIRNRISPRNYGCLVGYTPQQQKECVSMEITIVDEPCRGFGMQRLFVSLREEAARAAGAREAMVTVGPENTRSLHNLTSSGYEIIDTRPLYEGAMRHILRKQL